MGHRQPAGKTMREYLIIELGIKKPNSKSNKKSLDTLEATAQEYYDKDLKDAKKSFYFVEKLGKFVPPKAKKVLVKKLAAKGRNLDDEYLMPVTNIQGEIQKGTRFKEEIWLSRTAAELMMEANQEYYDQTGDQFVYAAGNRTPERQAISQSLRFHGCKSKGWGIRGLFSDFFDSLDCDKGLGKKVASCFGTAHHPGFAVDLKYGKMKNSKLARKILASKGFLVGCKVDPPHVDLSKNECW